MLLGFTMLSGALSIGVILLRLHFLQCGSDLYNRAVSHVREKLGHFDDEASAHIWSPIRPNTNFCRKEHSVSDLSCVRTGDISEWVGGALSAGDKGS